MDVPLSIQTERSHTEYPPPVLLSLMVSDGTLNKAARMKIRHYRQIYVDRPDPIVFLPIAVSTSGRVYEDFARLLFLHAHREASILAGELPEESEQFRFFRASRLTNLKGSVGLILVKASPMRVTIPIDLSTRSFIPLPRFFNSRRVPPLLNQSLVIIPQQSAAHDVRRYSTFGCRSRYVWRSCFLLGQILQVQRLCRAPARTSFSSSRILAGTKRGSREKTSGRAE
jgi:hypothetical protein